MMKQVVLILSRQECFSSVSVYHVVWSKQGKYVKRVYSCHAMHSKTTRQGCRNRISEIFVLCGLVKTRKICHSSSWNISPCPVFKEEFSCPEKSREILLTGWWMILNKQNNYTQTINVILNVRITYKTRYIEVQTCNFDPYIPGNHLPHFLELHKTFISSIIRHIFLRPMSYPSYIKGPVAK